MTVHSRPKSWREGPIVDPGVFVITQIKECRNRMGYCILGLSCNVDTDFVPDDLGGHCNQLSEAFNPKANFVCCKQNPDLFQDDKSDELEAVILEHNINHPTASESTSGTFGKLIFFLKIFCSKLIVEPEDGKEETIPEEENIQDNEEEKDEKEEEDKSPEVSVTDMIDELYTKPTTSVEDITKVMEDFIVI